MAFDNPVAVVASQARTTNGDSGAVAAPRARQVNLLVDVTAASGTTPTLDLTVEWSHDGTNFFGAEPADTFTQITAAKKTCKRFDAKAPRYRVRWTIGGTTPSFTFSIQEYDT